MFESSQQPLPINRSRPAPGLVDASPPGFDDDLALGCESAYPYLQIERWRQEVLGPPAG
jgi:hypothetical protein